MNIIASGTHQLHNALELSRGKLGISTESPKRADIIARALRKAGYQLDAPNELDHELLQRGYQ